MRSILVRSTLMFLLAAANALVNVVVDAADPIVVEEDHPLLNDPEVLQAMELFMGMSSEEREDTIRGLMEAVGDDPKKRAEMELIISKLPALDEEALRKSPGGIKSNLKQMIQDDELAKARQNARQMLDGTSWEFFVENQAAILNEVIASGQLSPEDAARFKTDEDAWMTQLRVIWEDVAKREL